jgi:hypothetical protein
MTALVTLYFALPALFVAATMVVKALKGDCI